MSIDTVESDMGLGIAMLFGLLALVGAVAMLAAPAQATKAWGFALATGAAVVAVVAPHAYA